MDRALPLSLQAAAWFFVGKLESDGPMNVVIECPFKIGRSPECCMQLNNRSVSGIHAKILEEDGGLWLYDLGSTNGTFVNGKRVRKKVELRDGDTVQFAAVVFQVSNSDNPPSRIRSEKAVEESASETLQTIQMERLFSGGVVPFFQPIVRINEGKQSVAGVELLGRSRIFGLRTPAQMFAAASRLEMEAELSRVQRRRGIELAQEGVPEELSLFVNTHPAELACDELQISLKEIRDLCPGRSLTLEVCESVLHDTARIIDLRAMLNDLEIGLAFDNFGQGQCQLFALSEVTPDVLKFDQNLIQGINKASAKRQNFVSALVKMILDLGVTPLAECVEGPEEHNTLKQLGFELAQGFHYGKPSSLPDIVEFIGNSSINSVQSAEPLVKSFMKSSESAPATQELPRSSFRFKNEDWLLEQPSNQYTIQVLSAISRERAEEHVAQQENPDNFAIFCKSGQTRMLYIVVCGVYKDRDEAKNATVGLTSATVSPWIRMLSGVHAEIRSNQSK